MPIKLPKGFPRRKSSGNVLDDFPSAANQSDIGSPDGSSSFKVLARPNSQGRSLDGGRTLKASPTATRQSAPRKSSFEEDSEDLFSVVRHDPVNRGSGGTNNSLATVPYDSAASSTRYSNSSTNPSSVDSGSGRNVKVPASQTQYDDIPVPPSHSKPSFLKNAGRTFSFGINKHNHRESQEQPPPLPHQTVHETRERAMTVSSVTTATPPRLDDSSFSIKSNDDDFGNMFAGLGSRSSQENNSATRPPPLRTVQRAAPPEPIRVNKNAPVESSPYSWHSQTSGDGLIGSPSPSRTVMQASPQPSTLRNITMETIRSEDSNEDNMFERTTTNLRHSPDPTNARPRTTTSPRVPPSAFPTSSMARVRAQSNGASSIQRSDAGSDFDQPAFDPSLLANAQLATQYEEKASSPQQVQATTSKVMTPAQFERYKQQKEDTRRYNKVFGKAESDEGSGDDYDDDEEDQQEREKSAAKQRKKQEAHLAVYRQQMKKVTGDVPSPEPRPGTGMGGNTSANASQNDLSMLNRRMSQMTMDTSIQPSYGIGKLPMDDEPEEDEDVPLGILAAHGFPNKNKPPTRLTASNSNPNLRNLAQVQGGTSVAGETSNRGSLPAFARNLPVDPYYGASLVHQSERAPLNMSQSQLAVQPQPSGAATAHPLHPAGLVGVIAGEERARAMRRGSPNTQGGYDMPPGAQQGMRPGAPSFVPGFPQPGMMMPQPMLTPTEHAQLQMSQSMTQMMQMQMQWMQQMQSMMQQNPNMPVPQMPQMPGMPMQGMPNMLPQQPSGMPHRPQSVPLQMAAGGQQRSMSTLTPGMGQAWHNSSPAVPQLNLGSVYAPSIAPSERSNVGLASRYRPVSTISQQPEPQRPDWNKRASTFSSATFRPWTNENGPAKSPMSTVRVIPQANDDEDDEQGWAEMKAKKEKKQRTWKLRKGGNQLQELYNTPA